MAKNYVLLYDNDKMIVPVKAKFNPHNGEPAYCGGQPQFFGGATEKKESVAAVLAREVKEEGIKTIVLEDKSPTALHQATVSKKVLWRGKEMLVDVHYDFYRSKGWKASGEKWPGSNEWNILPRDYREMCWVAEVPKSTFKIDKDSADWEIIWPLVFAATESAPPWAASQIRGCGKEESNEFVSSETCEAFLKFIRGWCADEFD